MTTAVDIRVEHDGVLVSASFEPSHEWVTTTTDQFGISMKWYSDVRPTSKSISDLVFVHRNYSAGITARN